MADFKGRVIKLVLYRRAKRKSIGKNSLEQESHPTEPHRRFLPAKAPKDRAAQQLQEPLVVDLKLLGGRFRGVCNSCRRKMPDIKQLRNDLLMSESCKERSVNW